MRTDTIQRQVKNDDGKLETRDVLVARGDLHLDKTALDSPPDGNKPLGIYVMDLAESDPEAFGTSLVLKADLAWRLDKHKQPERDKNGVELPPLWTATELHASDVVDTGDATNSLLSANTIDGLPDAALRRGVELLDQQFGGKSRAFVEARLQGFMERYLSLRFGDVEETTVTSTAGTEAITMPPPVDAEPEVTVTDEGLLLDIDLTLEDE